MASSCTYNTSRIKLIDPFIRKVEIFHDLKQWYKGQSWGDE